VCLDFSGSEISDSGIGFYARSDTDGWQRIGCPMPIDDQHNIREIQLNDIVHLENIVSFIEVHTNTISTKAVFQTLRTRYQLYIYFSETFHAYIC
jgi:hypothetical protein